MTISIDDGHKDTSRVIIYADTLEELNQVATAYTSGSQAYVINDSSFYRLNNAGEWVEASTGGGGGGASSWSQLTNKPFNTLNTNDFAVTGGELSLASSGGSSHGVPHRVEQLDDYLYEAWFDSIDYAEMPNVEPSIGACSSFVQNGVLARNFDWLYSEKLDVIVHTTAADGRHATLGVAGNVDQEILHTAALPFKVVDGINDAGIGVSTNVVPAGDKGDNSVVEPAVETKVELHSYAVTRFILDNFDNIDDAVDYICDYVKITNAPHLQAMGYEQHYLITDGSVTYCLEFIDGEAVVWNISSNPYMTNFHLCDTILNYDGTVTINQDGSGINESGVTAYGSGLERFNIIANNLSSSTTEELLESLKYTNAYNEDTSPFWYTEFVDDTHDVTTTTAEFDEIVPQYIEAYENRSRDESDPHYGTWQSCHSSIYDFNNLTLKLYSQEDFENSYEFELSSSNSQTSSNHTCIFTITGKPFYNGSELTITTMSMTMDEILKCYENEESISFIAYFPEEDNSRYPLEVFDFYTYDNESYPYDISFRMYARYSNQANFSCIDFSCYRDGDADVFVQPQTYEVSIRQLPVSTAADAGKILTVNNMGSAVWQTIDNANGVSF